MASDDEERLVVLLEARIRDYEKNLKKASGTTGREFGRMRKDSRSATRQMEADMAWSTKRINQALASTSTQIGVLGRSAAGAFAGGIFAGGLAGLAAGARGVVREVANIRNEAMRAGVTTEAFQEWQYVAEQARIPMDAMVDALKELNIRADEFAVTGKGSAAEAFARLGMTPEEVQQKLRDPSALMLELIERTRLLKDTAASTRIFDELFGGTGAERLVSLLGMSRDEIAGLISESHEFNRVLDDETISRAEELDRKFTTAWSNFETNAKHAILAVLPFLQSLDDKAKDFLSQFSLVDDIFGYLAGGESGGAGGDPVVAKMERRVKILSDQVENLKNLGFDAVETEKELAAARASLEAEVQRVMAGGGTTGTTILPPITARDPLPTTGTKTGRDGAAKAAERERQAVVKLIADLEFERSLIGATAVEREKANALRRAGAAATDEQRSRIEMLVEQSFNEKLSIEQQQEAYRQLEQIGTTAINSLATAFADGKLEASEMIQILLQVTQQLITMQSIGGGGGGGGILGALFGGLGSLFGGGGGQIAAAMGSVGLFEGGGFTGHGTRSGGVDGRGGFPAILHPNETVIDHTKGQSVGGSQNVHVTVGVTVDKEGSIRAFVQDIAKSEARKTADRVPEMAVNAVKDARTRRIMR